MEEEWVLELRTSLNWSVMRQLAVTCRYSTFCQVLAFHKPVQSTIRSRKSSEALLSIIHANNSFSIVGCWHMSALVRRYRLGPTYSMKLSFMSERFIISDPWTHLSSVKIKMLSCCTYAITSCVTNNMQFELNCEVSVSCVGLVRYRWLQEKKIENGFFQIAWFLGGVPLKIKN